MRTLVALLLLVLLSGPALAQDAEEPSAEPETATDSEADADADPDSGTDAEEEIPEFDEAGLDEQGFSNEDDDFNPSEDIPADQSIEFPADI